MINLEKYSKSKGVVLTIPSEITFDLNSTFLFDVEVYINEDLIQIFIFDILF